jgi:hypothetical protein
MSMRKAADALCVLKGDKSWVHRSGPISPLDSQSSIASNCFTNPVSKKIAHEAEDDLRSYSYKSSPASSESSIADAETDEQLLERLLAKFEGNLYEIVPEKDEESPPDKSAPEQREIITYSLPVGVWHATVDRIRKSKEKSDIDLALFIDYRLR